MALTLAHLSDVHLGPLPPGAAWENFALKRVVGTLNWKLRRHKLHDPAISSALVADIKAAAPDHVAFTGDLMNVSAYAEFPRAARWLQSFGDPSLDFLCARKPRRLCARAVETGACPSRPLHDRRHGRHRFCISLCAPAPEPGHNWFEFWCPPIADQGWQAPLAPNSLRSCPDFCMT